VTGTLENAGHKDEPELESLEVGPDLSRLLDRLDRVHVPGERLIIGIVGAPGAGKSTLAVDLAAALGVDRAVVVPMDGFHLATSALRRPEQVLRRGAIDTFDVGGFLSLLRRVRSREEDVVYAPDFDRAIEEPIAGSIRVARKVPIVITEGNYLLSTEPMWRDIRALLDEAWYLEGDEGRRRERLLARHRRFGKSEADALAFVQGSDERNAAQIVTSRSRADLVIRLP
jgi:pantothenate kinase